MDEKQIAKAVYDSLSGGTGIMQTGRRKWYNPMRWLRGLVYHKRINPNKFYA